MNNWKSATAIAFRIWFVSGLILTAGLFIFLLVLGEGKVFIAIPGFFGFEIGALPVLVIMLLSLPVINRRNVVPSDKWQLLILICAACALVYGTAGAIFCYLANINASWNCFWQIPGAISGILFATSQASLLCSHGRIQNYFSVTIPHSSHSKNKHMETEIKSDSSNRILIKGAITAVLIGIMMIPTLFISNLVQERKARNASVVKEVDSRWASAQTLTGPYIDIPYKRYPADGHLIIIPDNKQVSGEISHELRERSIYKVLLYRASVSDHGDFVIQIPKDIPSDQLLWSDAKICFGISDFKGIEEKLVMRFNGTENELTPGLPSADISDKGLSAPVQLNTNDIGKPIAYQITIRIKGSEQLHFIPLSGNSHFALGSTWPNPSFDGNNLPSERTVSEKGFSASWNFNKANLPFGTAIHDLKQDISALAFGVTMVQPADQYAKTDRSIKYAILIIGLTFSLFFIIELMQRKPIHPVQYVLIGLGLVIFYSLLLSISELLPFDFAYLIAAISTILLIGLYSKSHFNSWKSSGIFSGVLTLLYGFIFILISLEDTALLVGSIGLFIILALTMYGSKKVEWYAHAEPSAIS
jgi:inner membrane protein